MSNQSNGGASAASTASPYSPPAPPAAVANAPPCLAWSDALLSGWLLAALVGTATLVAFTRDAHLRFGSRCLLHLFDVGQTVLVGVLLAGAAALFERFIAPRLRQSATWGWCIAVVAATGAGVLFLPDDLAGALSRLLDGEDLETLQMVLCAAIAQVLPISAFLAGAVARKGFRPLPAVVGMAVVAGNFFVLEGDYPAVHLFLGASGAMCLAGSLVGLRRRPSRSLRLALFVPAIGLGAMAAFARPPSSVMATLGRTWTTALAVELSQLRIRRTVTAIGGDDVYRPGREGRDIPPTRQAVVPKDVIVIVYSVDSMRADVLADEYRERLPNIHALRDASTWFRQARSCGTQTAVVLSSVMTGKYFSQLYWQRKYITQEKVRTLWPAEDASVRFPALLADAGVPTVHFFQAAWLANDFGMTRGFSEEHYVKPVSGRPSTKGKWSTGDDVLPLMDARLAEAPGRMFVFFHDLDPHSPFDLGRVKSPKKEAWLAELENVDARIGELRRAIERHGLAERTVLVLTADHGEAFDDHGTTFHGQNLYEEQVRVPLLVYVPGAKPRALDDHVSLMDLGPTILDMFRLETPAHFMGQSLLPYWLDKTPDFRRPIIAEGRLRQSMITPEGLKLIRSQREGTFEIYDLTADPHEENNLFDEMGDEGERQMQQLIAFFEVHTLRRPGYEVPFRR